jgi:hypothetical protein
LECVDSSKGVFHSEETRQKMSKSHSGKNNAFYGKSHSEEAKKKVSIANKGRKIPEETRKKISRNMPNMFGENNPMYGKHPSAETRQKMSKSHSGEKCHNSKLTERQVFEILDLYYNKNVSKTNISKNFPVNRRAIYNICNGVTWKRCYKKFIKNR